MFGIGVDDDPAQAREFARSASVSFALLLDPANGQADLGRKELRTLYPTALYDDPARLLRLVRLRLRLGYAVEERTQAQYENARAAKVQAHISRRALGDDLKHIASEPNPSEVVRALEQDGLLALFSPALAGAKLNLAGLAKLEKVRRIFGVTAHQTKHCPAQFRKTPAFGRN